MSKELREYRIAEKVMEKTNNQANYLEVIEKVREKNIRFSLFSHDNEVIVNEIITEIMKNKSR